ncbi:MAG TPA: EamA family transporter [Candidatus Wallbacteria bacterium]|nr:EamA family transporter [Candidatus Wallbacteria bacterium]
MFWAYLALAGRIILLGYEKILVRQLGEEAESESATFLYFCISMIFFTPCMFWAPAPADYNFVIYSAVSSAIYCLAFLLYVRSLSTGEVSLVSPLYNFNVFFLLLLTAFFLGEKITILKVTGLSVLLYGASFLSRQRGILSSLKAIFKNHACVLMIICSFFMAIGRTIDGFVLKTTGPLVYGFSIYLFMTVFLFFYILYKGKFYKAVDLFKKRRAITLKAGAVNAYTYLFLLYAIARIDVSVAEPASMLSMIVTVFLSKLILNEDISGRLTGVLIMIAGAWALFL